MNYYNVDNDLSYGCVFNFVFGGRGIGKTYSTIDYCVKHNQVTGNKFLYLRRTKEEMLLAMNSEASPFKKYNKNCGTDIEIVKGKIPKIMTENNTKIIGYASSLSTFSNVRGMDFDDVDIIFLDEFIPEPGKVDILSKRELDAFFNMYETVNRNRELEGYSPCRVVAHTNANTLVSNILAGIDLIYVIEQMLKNGEEIKILNDISTLLHVCKDSEVSREKSNTALYRLAKGSKYYDMALSNMFAYDSFFNVKKRPIKEYIPICSYDGIFIYRHKNNGTYYACRTRASCPEYNSSDSKDLFMRKVGCRLKEPIISGKMYFSEMQIKQKILNIY